MRFMACLLPAVPVLWHWGGIFLPFQAGMTFWRMSQTVRRVGPVTWPPQNLPGGGFGELWPFGLGLARMIAGKSAAVNATDVRFRLFHSPPIGGRVESFFRKKFA